MAVTQLTSADIIVLSLLLERPMHGYELAQEYDRQEIKDWASVSKAQVYYALKKLEQDSLIVVSAQVYTTDQRSKTPFTVTPRGRDMLEQHLSQRHWIEERRPQPFTTWTGLSIHCSQANRDEMVAQRYAFLTAELSRERASFDFVASMTTDRSKAGLKIIALTIALIETELKWLETHFDLPSPPISS